MTEPETQPAPDKGMFARVIGIIVSPKETFEAVVKSPRPFGVLFLVCVILAVGYALPQMTPRGQQAVIDAQLQRVPEASPEMRANMERFAPFMAYATAGSLFITVPIMALVSTGVLWVIFNTILGGLAAFKQVLGVVAHAQVIGALGALAALPVELLHPTGNPAGPFNLGAVMPGVDPRGFLGNFLQTINVFQVWSVITIAIGLGTLYRRKTANIAIGLFVLYGLIAAAGAYMATTFGRQGH